MNICKNCSKEFTPGRNTTGTYCTNKCQQDFQYKSYINKWKAKEVSGNNNTKTYSLSAHVKKHVLEAANYTCSICGWDKRHPIDNLPLVEIDHIDGNASNSFEENLRVLCPNCHSMTETFKARNKNSARNRN